MIESAEAERKAFKDYFDPQAAQRLAEQMAGAMPRFDSKRFVHLGSKNLQALAF